MATKCTVRLSELLGCFALASDLASGLPLEHSLRRTLIAGWLGAEAGLDDAAIRDTFHVALLGSVACVLDAAAMSRFVGDEIALRGAMFEQDLARPLTALRFFGRNVARGQSAVRRASGLVGLGRRAGAISRDVALRVGTMLDLSESVRQALGQCDEHWNGKAGVLGLQGEQITVQARLFRLAQDIDVFHRAGGVDSALAVARARSGTYYDPSLVALFVSHAHELDAQLAVGSLWDAVQAAEPDPVRILEWHELDELARKIATVIDMRSAYTVGHSPAVAALAEGAANEVGLSADDARTLRSAGLLHDLGRAGVPVDLWDKPGPLTSQERGRMERHPALTELVLARSSSLGPLGLIAGLHHERLDGSGYRGVTSSSLPITARLLEAADAYQTKLEPRAHRGALPPDQAAAMVRDQAVRGGLDGDAVHGLLGFVGHRDPPREPTRPAGLTGREVEVLRLLVQGLSNREIAELLVISPKTVGRHVESIYSKTNVSTRVGATLFAVEHRIAAALPAPIRR